MPEETIVIYADFGMSPYAWRKRSNDTTSYVGSNIADAFDGLSRELGTSVELDKAFADWICRFDRPDYDTTIDWDQFHHDGVELAKRLKAEVGDRYEVEYCPPWEDPIRQGKPRTRVVSPDRLLVYDPSPNREGTLGSISNIETLSMELGNCQSGWIGMTLTCGDQKVKISLTHAFDPIPDFIKWMEELISDKSVCEFLIEEEGPAKNIVALNPGGGAVYLIITEPNREPIEYLRKTIGRRQLIETIYRGFQEFGKSPRYLPMDWELETLGQWLERQTGCSHSAILDFLETLDNRSVIRLLHALVPATHGASISDEVVEMKSLQEMLSYALIPDNPKVKESFADSPRYWIFTKVKDERRMELAEFLDSQVSTFLGTSLRTLRSEELEAYLASDREERTGQSPYLKTESDTQ